MKRYPAALMTAALVGAALQLWCQSAAFDPFTGLVEPGAASALALWAFFIAVPVLALLSALPLRGRAVPGEGELYGDLGPVGRLLGAVSGGLVAVGAILELIPDLRALMAFPRPARLGSCAVDALLWAGGLCLLALTLRGGPPQAPERRRADPRFWGVLLAGGVLPRRDPGPRCWSAMCGRCWP